MAQNKHVYPWQSNQLESAKYCKPKDFFQTGPAYIREAALQKMRMENEIQMGDGELPLTSSQIFRQQLDELVPNPSKIEYSPIKGIENRKNYFPEIEPEKQDSLLALPSTQDQLYQQSAQDQKQQIEMTREPSYRLPTETSKKSAPKRNSNPGGNSSYPSQIQSHNEIPITNSSKIKLKDDGNKIFNNSQQNGVAFQEYIKQQQNSKELFQEDESNLFITAGQQEYDPVAIARQQVNDRAMQLYREIHSSGSYPLQQESITMGSGGQIAMTSQETKDQRHDNAKFFQGYKDRIDFIKEMAVQVKQELSDDSDGSDEENSRNVRADTAARASAVTSSQQTNFSQQHQIPALTYQQQSNQNQMVPFIDYKDLEQKDRSSAQINSWKQKIQNDLEKRVMEHKLKEKAEHQKQVRIKTQDVKKSLAQKSELLRMEKLLQETKEAQEQKLKLERESQLKKEQARKLREGDMRGIYRPRNIIQPNQQNFNIKNELSLQFDYEQNDRPNAQQYNQFQNQEASDLQLKNFASQASSSYQNDQYKGVDFIYNRYLEKKHPHYQKAKEVLKSEKINDSNSNVVPYEIPAAYSLNQLDQIQEIAMRDLRIYNKQQEELRQQLELQTRMLEEVQSDILKREALIKYVSKK